MLIWIQAVLILCLILYLLKPRKLPETKKTDCSSTPLSDNTVEPACETETVAIQLPATQQQVEVNRTIQTALDKSNKVVGQLRPKLRILFQILQQATNLLTDIQSLPRSSGSEYPLTLAFNQKERKQIGRLSQQMACLAKLSFRVLITGSSNAGKSLFENVLLGQELLPSAFTAKTSIPTIVTHSQSHSVAELRINAALQEESRRLMLVMSTVMEHISDIGQFLKVFSSSPTLSKLIQLASPSGKLGSEQTRRKLPAIKAAHHQQTIRAFILSSAKGKDIPLQLDIHNDVIRMAKWIGKSLKSKAEFQNLCAQLEPKFKASESYLPRILARFGFIDHCDSQTAEILNTCQLSFIDSPGGTESMIPEIADILKKLFRESDALLWIIDSGQIQTTVTTQASGVFCCNPEELAFKANLMKIVLTKVDQAEGQNREELADLTVTQVQRLFSEANCALKKDFSSEDVFPVASPQAHNAIQTKKNLVGSEQELAHRIANGVFDKIGEALYGKMGWPLHVAQARSGSVDKTMIANLQKECERQWKDSGYPRLFNTLIESLAQDAAMLALTNSTSYALRLATTLRGPVASAVALESMTAIDLQGKLDDFSAQVDQLVAFRHQLRQQLATEKRNSIAAVNRGFDEIKDRKGGVLAYWKNWLLNSSFKSAKDRDEYLSKVAEELEQSVVNVEKELRLNAVVTRMTDEICQNVRQNDLFKDRLIEFPSFTSLPRFKSTGSLFSNATHDKVSRHWYTLWLIPQVTLNVKEETIRAQEQEALQKRQNKVIRNLKRFFAACKKLLEPIFNEINDTLKTVSATHRSAKNQLDSRKTARYQAYRKKLLEINEKTELCTFAASLLCKHFNFLTDANGRCMFLPIPRMDFRQSLPKVTELLRQRRLQLVHFPDDPACLFLSLSYLTGCPGDEGRVRRRIAEHLEILPASRWIGEVGIQGTTLEEIQGSFIQSIKWLGRGNWLCLEAFAEVYHLKRIEVVSVFSDMCRVFNHDQGDTIVLVHFGDLHFSAATSASARPVTAITESLTEDQSFLLARGISSESPEEAHVKRVEQEAKELKLMQGISASLNINWQLISPLLNSFDFLSAVVQCRRNEVG